MSVGGRSSSDVRRQRAARSVPRNTKDMTGTMGVGNDFQAIAVRWSVPGAVAGLAAGLMGAFSLQAMAAPADKAFTVASYPVEASDANAVVAKEKALAEGQQAAFRSLLKRIVPVTAYKQLSRLSGIKAADLVSGVAVRSERNSSTDYIASLDFSFQADAVRAALSREGIAFVEQQAEPVTIVTVMRDGNPAQSKNDTGPWRAAWSGLDLDHTLTPVKLESLKPVIHNDTVTMLLGGDESGLRILASEYKTDLVLLAIAEPDLAAKKMVVTLAGRDAVGPILLKRSYRISDGDLAYTSELAAVVGLGVLEGRWKAVKGSSAYGTETATTQPAWAAGATPGASASGERVTFVAEFSSLSQWNDMRTQLLDTPGVEDVDISTMSALNADVALRFPGGTQGLANAVGGRGLSLVNSGAGWTLRSTY